MTASVLRRPSARERAVYPLRAVVCWTYSNLHMLKQTLNVLDFMWWRKVGPALLPVDHAWLTGQLPDDTGLVWPRNIAFASPRKTEWTSEPEDDATIVTKIGRFLATMVARSNAVPEIPQGKGRRMPHAVNYLHGPVHYNGVFLLFNDFADAESYLSDPAFVREYERFARRERREATIVFRERTFQPEEYIWFLGFVRSRLIWYANANGPAKRRILHGTPSPYPAVNPINGSWIGDVHALRKGRLDEIARPPLTRGVYFMGTYGGVEATSRFVERLHMWGQDLVVRGKGFQGGLVFTKRKRIEPEQWDVYRAGDHSQPAAQRVPNPFRRFAKTPER